MWAQTREPLIYLKLNPWEWKRAPGHRMQKDERLKVTETAMFTEVRGDAEMSRPLKVRVPSSC